MTKAGSPRNELGSQGFLGAQALADLDRLYLAACASIEMLRTQSPGLGHHLATPKLPTALSEGIAALALPRLIGPFCFAHNPSSRDDMEIRPDGRIAAIKGTGASKWISITRTDLEADCLIWVDYSRRLVKAARTVDLWLFDRKVESWAKSNRLTFQQSLSAYGSEPKRIRVSLRRLTVAEPTGWRSQELHLPSVLDAASMNDRLRPSQPRSAGRKVDKS